MRKRIGIFGGGQLARMTALAAVSAGVEVWIYDPDPQCCAAAVATASVAAPWDDLERVRAFASCVDVVTVDREDVPMSTLAAASVCAEVCPSPEVMANVRNKLWQKAWLQAHGFPTAPFESVSQGSIPPLSYPGFLKAQTGTFDGRGVVRVGSENDLRNELAGAKGEFYFEEKIDFEREISVLVARSSDGATVVYDPAVNIHENHILDHSVFGFPLPIEVVREAKVLAREVAVRLGVVGLLVVEMFVTDDGELYINELAPRPHNSYHGSGRAFTVSQFEQLVRVLAKVRLEEPEFVQPSAIANLLGDAWANGEPDWGKALELSGVKLHLYGKGEPRPARKMGHLSAVGSTAEEAVRSALQARRRATRKRSAIKKEMHEHTSVCATGA